MSRRVSYIVLTKNSSKTLRRTLASIKKQQVPKEIIVVDAHSTDSTVEIAHEFKAKVLFDYTDNLARARNIGLDNSTGKYIAFVDSDAILFPGWDKLTIIHLQEDVAGVGCNFKSVGKSLVEQAQDQFARRRKGIVEVNSIATMNAMYDREKIEQHSFDERFVKAGEDLDFNIRLGEKGYRLLLLADHFIQHHNPATIMSLNRKFYNYGKWYMKPHIKNGDKNRFFELRRVYLGSLMMNMFFSIIYPPWTSVLLLQLFIPFLAYLPITKNIRFTLVHYIKFFAHLCGMTVSLLGVK